MFPSLRERKDGTYFIGEVSYSNMVLSYKDRVGDHLLPEALSAIVTFPWPNIRGLGKTVIHSAVIMCNKDRKLDDLPDLI